MTDYQFNEMLGWLHRVSNEIERLNSRITRIEAGLTLLVRAYGFSQAETTTPYTQSFHATARAEEISKARRRS